VATRGSLRCKDTAAEVRTASVNVMRTATATETLPDNKGRL